MSPADRPADRAPDRTADRPADRAADDAALPLDALLTEGARGARDRLLPAGPAARLALAALRRPGATAARAAGLLADLGRIGLTGTGPSQHDGPGSDDPRHDGWSDPLRARLLAAHARTRDAALDLVGDLAADGRDADRLRFAVARLSDLLAPGTHPLVRADAVRDAVRTRGGSAVRAGRALTEDLGTRPRVPGAHERLEPGVDTATAPGAVVLRTPLLELIHYLPATERVAEVPVLVVPPFANRMNLVDLTPRHSLVRHLVDAGHQVLALSWGPADPAHGLETYAAGLVEALDAVERITRTDRTTLVGIAGGGLLAAATTARLARPGRVAALVLAGAVLDDQPRTGPDSGPPVSPDDVRAAVAAATAAGLFDARRLTEVHALLAPRALVWPEWERRYRTSGAPDPLRAWNVDAVPLPAALYRDLCGLAGSGALARRGAAQLLGGPVDLAAVDRDAYVVAGVTDRIGCWQAAYRTTQLLGGKTRFVQVPGSTAAAVGYGGTSFRASTVSAGTPEDPERWRAGAVVESGSWWADLAAWLAERSGSTVDAPPELGGGRGLHPIAPAPGTYV